MGAYHLSIDIETYSDVAIVTAGMYKYAQSPNYEILLIGYAWGDEPPKVIDMTAPDMAELAIIRAALADPNVIKHAYNAAFEWYCLNQAGFATPLEQWRCTRLHGLYCGYTAALGPTAEAIGLPPDQRKDSTGKALIKYFCVPRKPTVRDARQRNLPHHDPDRWQLFVDYCAQDVVTERAIARALAPWPLPDEEQRLWLLDQHINVRGMGIDEGLVAGALRCNDIATQALMDEAVALSGLENPNSLAQLKDWLGKEMGEDVGTLRKDDVTRLIGETDNDTVRRMLEIRRALGKTSVAKYAAMREGVCADGRLRGTLRFYGANRTGRWAGQMLQPQNLPREQPVHMDYARRLAREGRVDEMRLVYGDVPNTLSQLIRTAVIPSPGNRLLVADFSAIEARVVAWLANETWAMAAFATHGKIYEATASSMFGVPIDRIAKGNPEYDLRQRGKVAVLALGYGGGEAALINSGALKMGLTEEELPNIKALWRQANKRIVGMWYALEAAALDTMQTGRANTVRNIVIAREGDTSTGQDFLTIRLPSGRKLYYARPYLGQGNFDKPALFYLGMHQQSRKWGATSTWGGKLVENITQAVARDCLAVSLMRVAETGYDIVFHVHDEIVIDARSDQRLEDVLAIMRQPIDWAQGLLLNADGFECDYYRKD